MRVPTDRFTGQVHRTGSPSPSPSTHGQVHRDECVPVVWVCEWRCESHRTGSPSPSPSTHGQVHRDEFVPVVWFCVWRCEYPRTGSQMRVPTDRFTRFTGSQVGTPLATDIPAPVRAATRAP